MISDEDVRHFFQNLDSPDIQQGESLQIYRGKSRHLWESAHPGGCQRHHTVFKQFGVIPEECFECYKVLINPRTVVELFKLLMVFDKVGLPNNNVRKCMVERRDYCAGAYKGFVYCKGIKDAKEVRNILRPAVADEISSDVPIAIKRGCSEFAQAYPNFSPTKPGAAFMKYNKNWRIHEDFVDKNFVFTTQAPDILPDGDASYTSSEIYAMKYWLSYAATIGDTSYLKVACRTLAPIPDLKRPPFSSKPTPQKKSGK